MPQFLTIGYGDQAGYDQTDDDVISAAHKHDQVLVERGAVVGIAGTPIQVRNNGGLQVLTEQGSFLNSSLPVAGFALIEAADMDEAVQLVSTTPCAVANGVVEVWPLSSGT